jgi:hypothetical protein
LTGVVVSKGSNITGVSIISNVVLKEEYGIDSDVVVAAAVDAFIEMVVTDVICWFIGTEVSWETMEIVVSGPS